MRLIDVNAYLKKVCTYNKTGCGSCRLQDKCPVNEPTVDAVLVVHGKWLPIIEVNEYGEPYQSGVYCSECGETSIYEPNYCPNCGADMRGEE